MTHQDKIAFIRQKAIEANPEIVELKFGCYVLWGKHNLGGHVLHRNYAGNYWIRIEGMQSTTTIKERQVRKIIGRPVRLTDVLLAVSHAIKSYDVQKRKDTIFMLAAIWEWREDSLEYQPEDRIEYVYSLLK